MAYSFRPKIARGKGALVPKIGRGVSPVPLFALTVFLEYRELCVLCEHGTLIIDFGGVIWSNGMYAWAPARSSEFI